MAKPNPTFHTLAANIKDAEKIKTVPEYVCKAVHPLFTIAPAIGVPINIPSDETANAIPILVPTTPKFGDNDIMLIAGRVRMRPEAIPYKKLKTTTPAVFFTPIQAKHRILATSMEGTNIFSGPVLSTAKFGRRRPKIEPALRIGRR
jgi:hypothetical protein